MQGSVRVLRIILPVKDLKSTSKPLEFSLVVMAAQPGYKGGISKIDKPKQHSTQVSEVSNVIGGAGQGSEKFKGPEYDDKMFGLDGKQKIEIDKAVRE